MTQTAGMIVAALIIIVGSLGLALASLWLAYRTRQHP